MPLGSVGDTRKELPLARVVDEIERTLKLTPDEYAAEAERVYQASPARRLLRAPLRPTGQPVS